MTDPREARLPKWAQAELARLRRDLQNVRDDFEEYADANMPEDVIAVVEPFAEHPRPVAREGEKIRLLLDGLDGYRWMDVSLKGSEVEVMASTGLRIVPQVTNVLHLSLTRD